MLVEAEEGKGSKKGEGDVEKQGGQGFMILKNSLWEFP
jgi:hypothetical protein